MNYFSHNSHTTRQLEPVGFLGFVSGNSSQLFSLPGGPVGFALGAEYRREKAIYTDDPFVESGADQCGRDRATSIRLRSR